MAYSPEAAPLETGGEGATYPIDLAIGILDYLSTYSHLYAEAARFSWPGMGKFPVEQQTVLEVPATEDINNLIEQIGGIPAGITDSDGVTQIVKLMRWKGVVDPKDPTKDLWLGCDPADPEEQGEISVGLLEVRRDLQDWSQFSAAQSLVSLRRARLLPPIIGLNGKPAATILR